MILLTPLNASFYLIRKTLINPFQLTGQIYTDRYIYLSPENLFFKARLNSS